MESRSYYFTLHCRTLIPGTGLLAPEEISVARWAVTNLADGDGTRVRSRRKAGERNDELEKMNTNLVTVAALW